MRHAEISTETFRAFQALVQRTTGIFLSPNKVPLLLSRTAPRLRATGIRTMADYLDALDGPEARTGELQAFINRMTTNKTDFFRERHHFDLLRQHALTQRGRTPEQPFRAWSAGCSSGEEPYSIAMTLLEAGLPPPVVDIVASDIDTQQLDVAKQGRYAAAGVRGLGDARLARWFLRGRGTYRGLIQVKPRLRERVRFVHGSLLNDASAEERRFDVVFCRNTLIYFDRETQRRVVGQLVHALVPGGLLFLGHSENLLAAGHDLEPVGMTAFRVPQTGERAAPAHVSLPGRPIQTRIELGARFSTASPALLRATSDAAVCVVLRDAKAGVSGMAVLLTNSGDRCGRTLDGLLGEMMRLGARHARMTAKVFGAAASSGQSAPLSAAAATTAGRVRTWLRREALAVEVERLGGVEGVQLRIETATGRVFARALGLAALRRVRVAETAWIGRASEAGLPLPQRGVS